VFGIALQIKKKKKKKKRSIYTNTIQEMLKLLSYCVAIIPSSWWKK